jgi:hypothetical protein
MENLYIGKLESISWLLNLKATGIHEFDPLFNGCVLLDRSDHKNVTLHLFVQNELFDDAKELLKKEEQVRVFRIDDSIEKAFKGKHTVAEGS